MATINRQQEIEFYCSINCAGSPVMWYVEGRFNSEGRFEPTDPDDIICIDCDEPGIPHDEDVVMT
jgi:hypothetical protein